MITVGMNYEVREGKEETFESLFNKVLDVMGGMEGHATSALYRDTNKPQSYLIVSEWTDRSAFDAFVSSDRFKSVTETGKSELLAARPKHEVYESSGQVGASSQGGCPMGH